MTPEQLIARLQGLGLLEDRILERLRRGIENPEKHVTADQVVKYLLKKEQITGAQARKLLQEIEQGSQAPPLDEMEVRQPEDNEYDTDDLTADVQEESVAPRRSDRPGVRRKPLPTERPVEVTTVDVVESLDPVAVEPAYQDPFGDPLSDPMQDPYASGASPVAGKQGPGPANRFAGKRYRPDQWQTRWLFIGFGILGLLLLFFALLYVVVGRQSAEDLFAAINKSFNDQTYGDTIVKCDEFLEKFPNDENAPDVKSLRVNALIADTYESKNWNETISRVENFVPPLLEDEEVDMSMLRQDLGVILPRTALAISEIALQQETPETMQAELEKARHAQEIATTASYVPTSEQKRAAETYQKVKDNILMVEGRIVKENRYLSTLAEIKQLSQAGRTDQAFEQFRTLTRDYGDLGARQELRDAMAEVSLKERELVKPLETTLQPVDTESPSPIESTTVLASRNGDAVPALLGEITPVLAEGTLYGIDVGDGSVRWRRFVGLETEIEPQPLGLDYLIVSDQRAHELACIGRRDNSLRWRIEVGEPFVAPAVTETALVLTTESGKVLRINPATGVVEAACQLPQGANVSALIGERDPYIYQPGLYSNLYVLSFEDLSCRDVYYLGHRRGAIQVPPVYWSGYLLVGVNGGASCDLYVLHGENGINLELIQLFPQLTKGPVTSPIQRIGRSMLVASEDGDLQVLSINPTTTDAPLLPVVQEKFERRGNVPTQFLAAGSVLYIAGKGIIRYKLQANQNTFRKPLIMNYADSFIAPLAIYDSTLIHTRRRDGSRMVSVSAVDAEEMKPIWRTDLGAPLAGGPRWEGGDVTAVNNQGDLFRFSPETEFAERVAQSSTLIENLQFEHRFPVSETSEVAVGPADRTDLLYLRWENPAAQVVTLQAPADRIACEPVVMQGNLIVPSLAGPVVRINPQTGGMVGTPYQPPIQPGTPQQWQTPTLIGENRLVIGNAAGDNNNTVFYLLDGGSGSSLTAAASVDGRPLLTGLVAVGTTAFGVVQGEQGQQLIGLDADNGLQQTGEVDLPGNVVAGPWQVANRILVALDNEQLACFDAGLNAQWSFSLPAVRLSGHPTISGDHLILAFEDGRVDALQIADGTAAGSVDLRQPLSGSPVVTADGEILAAGRDGSVHRIGVNQLLNPSE